MHNLHLIRVTANDGKEACDIVGSHIEDWGNENNWRTMCGAVSQDNEVYKAYDGRYEPDANMDTIAKINKMVEGWMKPDWYSDSARKALKRGKPIEKFNQAELYSLKFYTEQLGAIVSWKEGKKYRRKKGEKVAKGFDVLNEIFREYDYSEFGVTDIDNGDEGKIWIVFVDMHS